MEEKQAKVREIINNHGTEFNLEHRKKQIEVIVSKKRFKVLSIQFQMFMKFEEEKEELKKFEEGKIQIEQVQETLLSKTVLK